MVVELTLPRVERCQAVFNQILLKIKGQDEKVIDLNVNKMYN